MAKIYFRVLGRLFGIFLGLSSGIHGVRHVFVFQGFKQKLEFMAGYRLHRLIG